MQLRARAVRQIMATHATLAYTFIMLPNENTWRSANMFQLFRKSRATSPFKARSDGRDTDTDHARVASIFRSIEKALEEAKAEHAGLTSRISDVLARASVTMGNDSDEYLTRDP